MPAISSGGDDCVAVGAPKNDSRWGLNAGAVYVFEGGSSPDNTVDHVIRLRRHGRQAASTVSPFAEWATGAETPAPTWPSAPP